MWNHIVKRPDMYSVRQGSNAPAAKQGVAVLAFVGAWAAMILTIAAAWVTHVVVCIKASAWILLIVGSIVAPVGVVHGIGVWLGVF